MKNIAKKLSLLAAVGLTASATLSSPVLAEEVSPAKYIGSITAHNSDGGFCIKTENYSSANSSTWWTQSICYNDAAKYQYAACVNADSTNKSMKYSTAMSAFLAKKKVIIQANQCCGTGVPCIDEITIAE